MQFDTDLVLCSLSKAHYSKLMTGENLAHYRDFVIVLAVAGLIVPLLVRAGISSVLGFLLVGLLLNPDVPALAFLGFGESPELSALGDLGVVFLLFLIGLELSLERLITMKRLVMGLGGLQVLITTLVLGVVCHVYGYSTAQSIIIASALALSSTAIVIQILSDEKRMSSQTGRTSFAVLLMQDLAVIPLLIMVNIMARQGNGPILAGLVDGFVQASLAILIIIGVGRYALRPLLRLVAGANSPDLFLAATLLIAVGTGLVANMAGLSMALGAFISGLMLAETEYRRAIEAIIEPFKGLLLGAFFLVVGMSIDLAGLATTPVRTVTTAIVMIIVKAAIVYLLARTFRVGRRAALEAALLLGPGGEFAFVLLNQASTANLIDPDANTEVLSIVTLTMMATPLLSYLGRRAAARLAPPPALPAEAQITPPEGLNVKVIVAGFGRVGHLVCDMLAEHKISYIAVDSDAVLVNRERQSGHQVYYGDASNPAFLRSCGIMEASAIAITMDNSLRVDVVVKTLRALRDDIKIIARARDEKHAMRLYAAGVNEAVPETIESSLQLGEALLVESGVAMGLAIASVHERRDSFRKLLGRPNRKEQLRTARDRMRRNPTER